MSNPATKSAAFGHHPDPAIDFCVEVESIGSMVSDHLTLGRATNDDGSPADAPAIKDRIWNAMRFRVGGDAGAVASKAALRELEGRMLAAPAEAAA